MEHPIARKRVAVLFGGRSLEHEISVISAYQVMEALDYELFEPVPVYIDPEGLWYTGAQLSQRRSWLPGPLLKRDLQRVTLVPGDCLQLRPSKRKGLLRWIQSPPITVDVVFPICHGSYGEDGCLQGLLEMLGVPYVGPNHSCAAICMHKHYTKLFAASLGISVLPGKLLRRNEYSFENAEEILQAVVAELPLPLICKPCHLGSSIGISSAHTMAELLMAVAAAFVLDHEIVLEPLLSGVEDLNMAAISQPYVRLSAIERVPNDGGVLSFERKYLSGNRPKKMRGCSGLADCPRDLDPRLPAPIIEQMHQTAFTMLKNLEFGGTVRFDFLYQPSSQKLYLSETNPIPGSMAYYLWEAAQPRLGFTQMLSDLIFAAMHRKQQRAESQHTAPWKIFHTEPANH